MHGFDCGLVFAGARRAVVTAAGVPRRVFAGARAFPCRGIGRGAVVVTGASSGIGYAITLELAAQGYRVLAGVRSGDDFWRMGEIDGVEPVFLDVTDSGQVLALAKFVCETEPGGLHALINNAGIALVGAVETLELDAWRQVLEVNVLGTVAVTRALLPSLLARRGRVVNIGSGAGRLAFPLFGPYAASKFALEGLTDVLRREVAPHGVDVVCVRPGVVATPIYEKSLPGSYQRTAQLEADVAHRYQGLLDSAHASAERASVDAAPASAVALVVAKALAARRPRTRYVCGRDSRAAVLGARLLPDRAIDAVIARLTAS